MRKLTWSLLLPFVLLFAQIGELRHEIGHLSDPPESSQKQKPGVTHPCEVCLAYAHLAGAATVDVVPPALLGDLAYHFPQVAGTTPGPVAALAPRSRGPPTLLQIS
jgi:hypothetical protein